MAQKANYKEITIFVDDRERSSRVPQILRESDHVKLFIQRLPFGDYLIDGRVIVERKTIPDFIQSLKTGRLWVQAGAMLRFPRRRLFILEGDRALLSNFGVHREAVQGAILSLTLKYCLPVIETNDSTETAEMFLRLPHYLDEILWSYPVRFVKSHASKRTRQLQMIQCIPQVGAKKAQAVLARFDSIQALSQAEIVDIQEIPGIGRKTAESIYSQVHEQNPVYGSDQHRAT